MSLNDHATEDGLEEYAMGRLPEAEAGPLEEHLLVCQECRDRLEETEQYIVAMRSALRLFRGNDTPKKHGPL